MTLFLAGIHLAYAGESPFGWIYLTDTHPKGKKEFEQWFETQRGQSQGEYTNILLRSEIEYGVTDNCTDHLPCA